MKPPLPPVPVPGKTEFERFDNAVRKILTVSKEELQRRINEGDILISRPRSSREPKRRPKK